MAFNTPSTQNVGTNGTKFCLFRQAAWPAWAEYGVTGQGYMVTYSASAPPGVLSEAIAEVNPGVTSFAIGNVVVAGTVSPSVTGLLTTFAPGYPIVGIDSTTGAGTYTYIPAGFRWNPVVSLSASLFGVNYSAEIVFAVWNNPGSFTLSGPTASMASVFVSWTNTDLGAIAANVQAPQFTVGTWIRPVSVRLYGHTVNPGVAISISIPAVAGNMTYVGSAANAGAITVAPTALGSCFLPINMLAEYKNTSIPWSSTRLTACSMLATNVTSVLNKGGTIICARLNPNRVNAFSAVRTDLDSIHPSERAFLPLETGLYTYCAPSTDMAEFYDYTGIFGVGFAAPVFRLDNEAVYNIAYMYAPATLSETMAMNIDWHIEFRTSSTLFDIGVSTMTVETLHQAQIVLLMSGFFFENSVHKWLLNKVISGAKMVAPHLNTVADMVGLVNPAAGKIGHMVADMVMPRKPESKMVSTSLSNSNTSQKPPSRSPSASSVRSVSSRKVVVAAPKVAASSKGKKKKKKGGG